MQVGGIFKHYDPEALKAAKDSGGYAPDFSPTAAKRNQELSDAMYSEWSKKVNIMVLTAAIPGRPPPALVSKAMVNEMLPGSVIVDLAASDQWAKVYMEACKKNGGGKRFFWLSGNGRVGEGGEEPRILENVAPL